MDDSKYVSESIDLRHQLRGHCSRNSFGLMIVDVLLGSMQSTGWLNDINSDDDKLGIIFLINSALIWKHTCNLDLIKVLIISVIWSSNMFIPNKQIRFFQI